MDWIMSFTWHFILTNLIKINFVVFDLQGDELNEAQFDLSDSKYVIILGMSWTKHIEMHWFMFFHYHYHHHHYIQWWESAIDKSPPLSLLSKPHYGGFLTGGNNDSRHLSENDQFCSIIFNQFALIQHHF